MGHGRLARRRCDFLRVDRCGRAYGITAAHPGLNYTGIVNPVAVIDGAFPTGGINGVADITCAIADDGRLAAVGKTERPEQQQDSVELFHNCDPMVVIDY